MTIIPLATFVASSLFVAFAFRSKSSVTLVNKVAAPKENFIRTTRKFTSLKMSTSTPSSEEFTMRLQHPGTCTGMYWRGDPFTGKGAPSNDNWPRNGALLRGTGPYEVRGEKYFKVSSFQQAGSTEFVSVPEGTWMLYSQGGDLLHRV